MPGLPADVVACLFDLDGVLTDTARLHEQAWATTFASYGFTHDDYLSFVDGRPREDGVRSFLASRSVTPSDAEVEQLATTKNDLVLGLIASQGVDLLPGARDYLTACMVAGIRRVVVSSSANTTSVLRVTGLTELVEDQIDGIRAKAMGLKGKPAPDTFLAGARLLGLVPSQCAVFEDAIAGVEAGRAGGFGWVVGIGHASLAEHGASVVVPSLEALL